MISTRLALLATLAGAAPLAAQQPTRLTAFGPELWVRMDTVTNWILVPGSSQESFRKTHHAYTTLKIKTDLVDSLTGRVGATGFKQTGSFAGRRMSQWIRCGEGLTGPNADTWRISMAVLSAVERVSNDTSRIRTLVVATARNLAEGSSTPMACASTGELEASIHQKVKAMPPGQGSNGN